MKSAWSQILGVSKLKALSAASVITTPLLCIIILAYSIYWEEKPAEGHKCDQFWLIYELLREGLSSNLFLPLPLSTAIQFLLLRLCGSS